MLHAWEKSPRYGSLRRSRPGSALRPFEAAERDRVPQCFRCGDGVLPRRSCLAVEHVRRAPRKLHLPCRPVPRGAAAEAEPCAPPERDADDDTERRRIAVPADGGALRVAL